MRPRRNDEDTPNQNLLGTRLIRADRRGPDEGRLVGRVAMLLSLLMEVWLICSVALRPEKDVHDLIP
jgi:hypothetical protein